MEKIITKEWNTLILLNEDDCIKFDQHLGSLKFNLKVENYINNYFYNIKFLNEDSRLSTFLKAFNVEFKSNEQIFETFQLNLNYPKLNEFITQNYDDLKDNRFDMNYLKIEYKLPFDSVNDICCYFDIHNDKYLNNNIFYFLRYLYSKYTCDDEFFKELESSNNKKINCEKLNSNIHSNFNFQVSRIGITQTSSNTHRDNMEKY
jgi:hypothetical protein